MTTVRQIAIAFCSSVMPSLRNEFFQASILETSDTLSERTVMCETTAGAGLAACNSGLIVIAQSARKRMSMVGVGGATAVIAENGELVEREFRYSPEGNTSKPRLNQAVRIFRSMSFATTHFGYF